jgi:hypothetical protein
MSGVPAADRPFMPGYGVVGPSEGSGLLSWAWAAERLGRSHDYWLATMSSDGSPHLMPVWATWLDGDAENAKYGSDYSIDTLDQAVNTCFKVRPVKVIGLDTGDFTGSPTRWVLS